MDYPLTSDGKDKLIKDLESQIKQLQQELEQNKVVVDEIKRAWSERTFTSEGEDFDIKFKIILSKLGSKK